MTVKSDIYDKLVELFEPGLLASGASAATIAQVETNWDSLAEAMALGAPGPGGLTSGTGADGYVTFYTSSTGVAGDNDLYFDRVGNQLQLNQPLRLKDIGEAPATPSSTYGLIYVKGDAPFFMDDSGTEFALSNDIGISDLTQTVEEHKQYSNQTFRHVIGAGDGYQEQITAHVVDAYGVNPHNVTPANVGNTTAQWNADKLQSRIMDFQAPLDREVITWNAIRQVWEPEFVSAQDIDGWSETLDGYANKITEKDHHRQLSQAIHVILKDLDGYGQTEIEHHIQSSDAIQSILKDLDGYAQTETEHTDQANQVFQNMRFDMDGYQREIDSLYLDAYWLAEAIDIIKKDLDGYVTIQTETEHHNQLADAIHTVRKGLDGYEPEHSAQEFKNAMGSAIHTIRKDLDGYAFMSDVRGSLVPGTNDTYSLGTTNRWWSESFVGPGGTHVRYNGEHVSETRLLATNNTAGSRNYPLAYDKDTRTFWSTNASLGVIYSWFQDNTGSVSYSPPGSNGLDFLDTPRGIAALNGSVYIIDSLGESSGASSSSELHRYDPDTQTSVELLDTNGMVDLAFNRAGDRLAIIGVSGGTSFYILNYVFDPSTKTLGALSSSRTFETASLPAYPSVTFGKGGQVFATAQRAGNEYKLYQWDSVSNPVVTAVDGYGASGNEDMRGVWADEGNNIYVTDYGLNRIYKWPSTGTYGGLTDFIVLAGDGTAADTGDGGHASGGQVNAPWGIVGTTEEDGYLVNVDHDADSNVLYFLSGVGLRKMPFDFEQDDREYKFQVSRDTKNFELVNTKWPGVDTKIITVTEDGYVGIWCDDPNESLTIGHVISMANQAASPPLDADFDGYGKLWVNSDNSLIYRTSAGIEYDLISDDIRTTIHEHYVQLSEAVHHLTEAADAYGTGASESEHYEQLGDAISTIRKDLDGYRGTINEHYEQHSDAFDSIRKELDGYAMSDSHGDGYVAFYSGDGRKIAGDNDLYFDRVNNRLALGTQNPRARLTINDVNAHLYLEQSDESLDNPGGVGVRFLENSSNLKGAFITFDTKNNRLQLGTHIAADSDTNSDNPTLYIESNATLTRVGIGVAAIDELTIGGVLSLQHTDTPSGGDFDGYGKILAKTDNRLYHRDDTGAEHNIPRGTDLDAYGEGLTELEHYKDHSEAIDLLRQAADGYGNVFVAPTEPADGYLAVWANGNTIYGDNDLYYDISTGFLGLSRATPAEKLDVNGTVKLGGFKMTTGAVSGYTLQSDSSGVGTWQEPAANNFDTLLILRSAGTIIYNSDTGNVYSLRP